jgi:hypothetical protein
LPRWQPPGLPPASADTMRRVCHVATWIGIVSTSSRCRCAWTVTATASVSVRRRQMLRGFQMLRVFGRRRSCRGLMVSGCRRRASCIEGAGLVHDQVEFSGWDLAIADPDPQAAQDGSPGAEAGPARAALADRTHQQLADQLRSAPPQHRPPPPPTPSPTVVRHRHHSHHQAHQVG